MPGIISIEKEQALASLSLITGANSLLVPLGNKCTAQRPTVHSVQCQLAVIVAAWSIPSAQILVRPHLLFTNVPFNAQNENILMIIMGSHF